MPEAASRNHGAPYASPLAAELADDVLERFLRYVVIDTQADVESTTYPSSEKQLDLSRLLVEELRSIGLEDVASYPALFAALLDRGWSEADCARLAGGNVLRVLRAADGP